MGKRIRATSGEDRQEWLFDPGPQGVSERMWGRRLLLREVCGRGEVRLLRMVAARLGVSYSTFLRWRRQDPELANILIVVMERKRIGRRGRR